MKADREKSISFLPQVDKRNGIKYKTKISIMKVMYVIARKKGLLIVGILLLGYGALGFCYYGGCRKGHVEKIPVIYCRDEDRGPQMDCDDDDDLDVK